MNNTPSISIILPVFNSEKFIAEAIDSILDQTYKNFELIILNDGSTDDTADIIKSYQDERIHFVNNKENLGVSKTLNLGLNIAKHSLIARMDADDFSFPNRLQVQVDFLNKNPEVDVCGSAVNVYEHPSETWMPPITHEEITTKMLFECCIFHPTTMFKKDIILSVGGYNPKFSGAEDYDLWQRLGSLKNINFANLPLPLVRYRSHNTSNKIYTAKQFDLSNKIRARYLHELGLKPSSSHHDLACSRLVESIPSLDECSKWMEKISGSNNKLNIYPSQQLQAELEAQWLRLCLYVARSNLNTFIYYATNNDYSIKRGKYFQSLRILWHYFKYKLYHEGKA